MLIVIQFKRQRKDQSYKTTEIDLLCNKVMCLFRTKPFTRELIANRQSELSLQVDNSGQVDSACAGVGSGDRVHAPGGKSEFVFLGGDILLEIFRLCMHIFASLSLTLRITQQTTALFIHP